MICPPCKSAGKYLSADNAKGAELAHSMCKSPVTCPCQHRTVSVSDGKKQ